jgi:uncharacterized membrane protein YeiH
MNIQYYFELFGTLVFAISGALAVDSNKQDWMGASFMAFITAIGGGTLRDLLLGSHPLVWMEDLNIMWTITAGILIAFFFQKHLRKLRKTLWLFDTIGIALFTIVGAEKALGLGVYPVIAAIMGMFSAVFGGVIRDTLTNEIPILFKPGLYSGACLAGATVYLVLDACAVERTIAFSISFGVIFALRIASIRYHWVVPSFSRKS